MSPTTIMGGGFLLIVGYLVGYVKGHGDGYQLRGIARGESDG